MIGDSMRVRNRSIHGVALAIALWPCVHGCDTVNGGAVELSWKFRPASSSLEDKFVNCDSKQDGTNPVTAIRLQWPEGNQVQHDEWPCDDSHGVTGFALPPGPTLFSVVPLCGVDAPADPDSYIAPAAEQRNVILGDTVSLGAIELVVLVSYCDAQPCICH